MTHRSEVRSNVRVRGAAVALWLACALMAGAETAAAERATALLQQVTGTPTIVELTDGAPRDVSYATVGVAAPITTVTSTVTAPVAPIVNDVTAPRGGLLGKRT